MPSLDTLRSVLMGEGYSVSEWADEPGAVYSVQSNTTTQVRWVLRGKLRIGFPESGEEFILAPGDRLDIPPDTLYWIDVQEGGPALYLSATRNHQAYPKRNGD